MSPVPCYPEDGGNDSNNSPVTVEKTSQQEESHKKDEELGQLRAALCENQRVLQAKEMDVVRQVPHQQRYQYHSSSNPYQQEETCSPLQRVADCWPTPVPRSTRTVTREGQSSQQHLRFMNLVHIAILCFLVFHFFTICTSRSSPTSTYNNRYDQPTDQYQPEIPPPPPKKPWESTPPTAIGLLQGNLDASAKLRHSCIHAVRVRQQSIFSSLGWNTNASILLVDPAYHANVGDHMLTLGELELVSQSLKRAMPEQCHYKPLGFYEECTQVITGEAYYDTDEMNQQPPPPFQPGSKIALWHAGGNWGDLWHSAQEVRIPSIRTLLWHGYQVVSMPQSLYYGDEDLKMHEAKELKKMIALGLGLAKEEPESVDTQSTNATEEDGEENPWTDGWMAGGDRSPPKPLKVDTKVLDTAAGRRMAKSRVTFMWREKESYSEAQRIYPFVQHMIVPDMGFQLGPYAPIRNHPDKQVDILILLREDHESKVTRDNDSIRSLFSRPDVSFQLVDWGSRLELFDTDDFFFTDTAIELLSLGKVVVSDRLHGVILSYLLGIPFVYVDQIYGKITKTLRGAFDGMEDECLDGEQTNWVQSTNLQEALAKAVELMDRLPSESSGLFGN